MWHPTSDELVRAALPGDAADPRVAEHTRDCPTCAEELAALRRTVGRVRALDPVDDVAPPPELWDRISRATLEAEPRTAAPPAGAERATPFTRRPVLAVAAAAVAVLAVVAAVVVGRDAPTDRTAAPAPAPTAPARELVPTAPGVVGTVQVVDGAAPAMVVDVVLPAPLPADEAVELWERDPGGMRSLGLLVPDRDRTHLSGRIAMAPGAVAPAVDLSVEEVGGAPGHSGRSLAHSP